MTRMRVRWAVAAVSALALALLTLSVPLEWPFHRHDAVTEGGTNAERDASQAYDLLPCRTRYRSANA